MRPSLALRALARFEQAQGDLRARGLQEAAAGFEEARALCGDHGEGPSALYLERSLASALTPEPGGWAEEVVFESK